MRHQNLLQGLAISSALHLAAFAGGATLYRWESATMRAGEPQVFSVSLESAVRGGERDLSADQHATRRDAIESFPKPVKATVRIADALTHRSGHKHAAPISPKESNAFVPIGFGREPQGNGIVASAGDIRVRYPWLARKRGIEGTVVIQIILNEVGTVRESNVIATSGSTLLDQAALEAIRQAHFPPHTSVISRKIAFRFTLAAAQALAVP